MHPLALAPCGDDANLAQIGEMPGNLRLRRADDLREVADTDLLPGDQIEKPQAGRVAERAKKLVKGRVLFHTSSLAKYIRLDEYVGCWYV
jgi:hypothetical protein